MTWRDRLKETIDLTSPDGNVFVAFWSNNTREFEKKLGIFEYPKVKGTDVQDLGIIGTRYPLTIWFQGQDNDLEANRFFDALKESGTWQIVHPVLGSLTLQLSTITQFIDPTKSGNITKFETEWIEPLDQNVTTTAPELTANIDNQFDELNIVGADQLEANISQNLASDVVSVRTTTNLILNSVTTNLSSLYSSVSALNAQANAIISSIQDTIAQPVIDVLALAGQIQNLIELPLLAVDDLETRLSAYGDMIAETLGLIPTDTTTRDKNRISVIEVTLTAVLGSLALIVSTSNNLSTKKQATDAIETIGDQFINITDSLDTIQTNFIARDIDLQYFSQSQSFSDAAVIMFQAIAYLSIVLFDLAIENTITITAPTAPINITIQEYGELGSNDINFDTFIELNKLKGKEILILPAGREVVVYV